MTLTLYKSFAAMLIFAISLIAVIYPLRRQLTDRHNESLELGEAFASGIFLGTAFFHMLPESLHLFQQLYGDSSYPLAEIFCVFGFILMLFLERLTLVTSKFHSSNSVPYILTIILILHALIEGIALGVNTMTAQAILLFIAIAAHKGSDTFALCMTLIRHHWTFTHTLITVTVLALMTPLGILFGTSLTMYMQFTSTQIITAVFNGFAAGTFIYIATLYHIRFHQRAQSEEAQHGFMEFLFLLAGLVLMGVIVAWV